jgi:cation diffusion facilitator CzcD-associated flavoprotein CzcO
VFKGRSNSLGGYTYTATFRKPRDDPPEVRQAFYEKLWAYGDFHFWFGGYMDLFFDENANTEAYEFWCKKVRARLHNPEMQEKLAPLIPPHAFGTKRPSLELNYYEVFNQPNVDLIDIRTNPIDCFTSTGIRTKDGINHECDVIGR